MSAPSSRMSRDNPKASRLFANEILHGAPAIGEFLSGPLKTLVDETAVVMKGWIAAGTIADVDPVSSHLHHLGDDPALRRFRRPGAGRGGGRRRALRQGGADYPQNDT